MIKSDVSKIQWSDLIAPSFREEWALFRHIPIVDSIPVSIKLSLENGREDGDYVAQYWTGHSYVCHGREGHTADPTVRGTARLLPVPGW